MTNERGLAEVVSRSGAAGVELAFVLLVHNLEPRPIVPLPPAWRRFSSTVPMFSARPYSTAVGSVHFHEPVNLARQLKDILPEVPIETLGALCNVSRNTFYEWQRNGRLNQDNENHVRQLIVMLNRIKQVREDLPAFLNERESGDPVRLAQNGRFDSLLSLAYGYVPRTTVHVFNGKLLKSVPSVAAASNETTFLKKLLPAQHREGPYEPNIDVYRLIDEMETVSVGAFIVA